MANIIRVQAGKKPFDSTVLLYETDERHPGGEAFVARRKDQVYEVAQTAAVSRLLESGLLKRAKSQPEPVADTSEGDTTADGDTGEALTFDKRVDRLADELEFTELKERAAEKGIDTDGMRSRKQIATALIEHADEEE